MLYVYICFYHIYILLSKIVITTYIKKRRKKIDNIFNFFSYSIYINIYIYLHLRVLCIYIYITHTHTYTHGYRYAYYTVFSNLVY